ncbi:MAG TPA: septum formation family protein [Nocardioidaceae bacterium]|nr:septum formation family protein [Nocardioidaceae bacterium]
MRPAAALLSALLVLGTVAACGSESGPSDLSTPPKTGVCRALVPEDITRSTNDTLPVDCSSPHTAETFLVGTFLGSLAEDDFDDAALGAFVFDACQAGFMKFLGGDESLVKRSTLTWAWFRPSEKGWDSGARWFRCDVIGGGEQSKKFVNLPLTTKGVLLGRPDDQWLTCAEGPTVAGSVKVPCSEPHDWRAISTIVLGKEDDPYPGDHAVEVKTREFCSDQVAAYLNYPVLDYDFGYTWFHEGEWKAGNRRSVCWAKTDQ